MPNELELISPQFLDEMDEEQEEQLFSVMLAKKQKRTEDGLKRLFDAVKKESEIRFQETEALKLSIERQKEDAEKQLELERKRHRVTESKFGFVTLRELGVKYDVPMGNKTMAKLLKIAGLAITRIDKDNKGYTAAKMECIRDNTATNDTYEGHDTYKWNPEKTMNKIDRWLEKNGYIDQFYACEDQTELYKLINELYSIYVEG